jgi:E3 ubiquitin-protein ligase TRIP12
LEALICGSDDKKNENWSKEALLLNIMPSHGYNMESKPFLYFIEYISSLESSLRPIFLRFMTGAPRLPFGGFTSLNPKLTVVERKADPGRIPDEYLPSVMT